MKTTEIARLERLLNKYLDTFEFEEEVIEAWGGAHLDVGDLIVMILEDIDKRRRAEA